jgi:alpha-glucosidase
VFLRRALALRRSLKDSLPPAPEWLDDFPTDVLAFRRGTLTCVTNFGDSPVRITGEVSLASGPLDGDLLPGGTSVWLAQSLGARNRLM